MSHSYIDRHGGHELSMLDDPGGVVTVWTAHGRKYVKRESRRNQRRKERRITAAAVLQYELERQDDMREAQWLDYHYSYLDERDQEFIGFDYVDDNEEYYRDQLARELADEEERARLREEEAYYDYA